MVFVACGVFLLEGRRARSEKLRAQNQNATTLTTNDTSNVMLNDAPTNAQRETVAATQ